MSDCNRVLIAGAGPVGMVAAAALVRSGIPVTVFESGATLSTESRASTFHPPTLDMLDTLGVAKTLIALGRIAPTVQYRTRDKLLAEFDFGEISDVTSHPYRLQCEQYKLTKIIYDGLLGNELFAVEFNSQVVECRQSENEIYVTVKTPSGSKEVAGRYLVAADGASSLIRKSLAIDFDGFTWPEKFLVVSTPFDFEARIPGLSSVSYVADPHGWNFYLRIPDVWRIMFPVGADVSDESAQSETYVQRQMANLVPGVSDYEVRHVTLYKVHQRVAKTYRAGRAFLAGDAAHINNPLGGMGMNGGVHDAINLTERIASVWKDGAPETHLDGYDLQRRQVTIEFVQRQTIQNKANLEAKEESAFLEYQNRMRGIAGDAALRRKQLLDISMLSSLSRAKEFA